MVTCNFGTLAGTAGASVTIVVNPMAAGTITNQATVVRNDVVSRIPHDGRIFVLKETTML